MIVPFRGRAGIGVFNVNGTYYALRNLCPHKAGPLCTGRVSGRIVADAPPTAANTNLDLVRDGEIILFHDRGGVIASTPSRHQG